MLRLLLTVTPCQATFYSEFLNINNNKANMTSEEWNTSLSQRISFTAFLANTLEKYPFGFGVFQEWLANADDAGATKFKFILDYDTYPINSLLFPSLADWQGPSVIIYNDSEFSNQDWTNFTTKIGNSYKRYDSTTIGNFGLGALTAYHFTDLITVVSGSKVLLLDVHSKYLQSESLHGDFIEMSLAEKYPDQFASFAAHGCSLKSHYPGTMFRLPLRTDSITSDITNKKINEKDITNMLKSVEADVGNLLLFLPNIKSLECYEHMDGRTRLLFKAEIPSVNTKIENLQYAGMSVKYYELDVSVTCGDTSKTETWAICEGTKDKLSKEIDTNGRKAVPKGGIAIKLDLKKYQNKWIKSAVACKGKGFCYLPLLSDEDFHLPVHLNGAFQLSDDRRSLWSGKDGKSEWNTLILTEILAPLWVFCLEKFTHTCETFVDVFPGEKTLHNWDKATTAVWEWLEKYDNKVFVCEGCNDTSHNRHYVGISECFYANETSSKQDTVSAIVPILLKLGMHTFKKPSSICKVLAHKRSITPQAASVHFKQLLNNFKLLDLNEISILVKYLLREDADLLKGLPVVPLCNGEYGIFGNTHFLAPFPEIIKIIDAKHFVNKDTQAFGFFSLFNLEDFNIIPMGAQYMSQLISWKGPERVLLTDLPFTEETRRIYWELVRFYENWEYFSNLPIIKTQRELISIRVALKNQGSILNSTTVKSLELRKYLANKLDIDYIEEPLDLNRHQKSFLIEFSKLKNVSLKDLLVDIKNDNLDMFKILLRDLIKTEQLHLYKDCPILKTMDGNYISQENALVIDFRLANIISPDYDNILLDNSCEFNKTFLSQFPLTDSTQMFCKLHIIPKLSQTNPKIEIMQYIVRNGYCREELANIAFVEVNGRYYKPSELLDEECTPTMAEILQRPVPTQWSGKILRQYGMPTPTESITDCIKAVKERPDRYKLIDNLITELSFTQNNTLKRQIVASPIIPAQRRFEPPYDIFMPKLEEYYTTTQLYHPKDLNLIWTVKPVVHQDIVQCHLLSLSTVTLTEVLANLINIANSAHKVPAHLMAELDSIIDANLTFISKSLPQSKFVVKERLERVAFVRLDTGQFTTAANLCFSLSENAASMKKPPSRMEKFKDLLLLLGAESASNSQFEMPDMQKLSIAEFVKTLFNSKTLSDVTFIVEDKEISAHRLVLSNSSPKFYKEFCGNFKESSQQNTRIVIEDHTFEGYYSFLKFLYTGTLDPNSDLEIFMEVSQLADEHLMDSLKEYCEKTLLHGNAKLVKVENVCHLWTWAKGLRMSQLEKLCKTFANECIKTIIDANAAKDLTPEDIMELFGKKYYSKVPFKVNSSSFDFGIKSNISRRKVTIKKGPKSPPKKTTQDVDASNSFTFVPNPLFEFKNEIKEDDMFVFSASPMPTVKSVPEPVVLDFGKLKLEEENGLETEREELRVSRKRREE